MILNALFIYFHIWFLTRDSFIFTWFFMHNSFIFLDDVFNTRFFFYFIYFLFIFLPFNSLCMTGLFSCENVFHIYFPPCDCYMINWFSYVILHDLLSFTFSHFHIIFVCAIWMTIALDDMIKTWADNSFSYIQRCIYVCSACAHY